MWGRWEASSAKPFGKTLSRRSLVAAACWSIVASGFNRMSMAVTEASAAIARPVPRASMARAHAIDPLSQSRLEVVVFIVVSFRFVLVIGLLKAAALRRLTMVEADFFPDKTSPQ